MMIYHKVCGEKVQTDQFTGLPLSAHVCRHLRHKLIHARPVDSFLFFYSIPSSIQESLGIVVCFMHCSCSEGVYMYMHVRTRTRIHS